LVGNFYGLDSDASVEEAVKQEAEAVLREGKPRLKDTALFLPLVIRNSSIGIACFLKEAGAPAFCQKDFELANNLTCEVAGL